MVDKFVLVMVEYSQTKVRGVLFSRASTTTNTSLILFVGTSPMLSLPRALVGCGGGLTWDLFVKVLVMTRSFDPKLSLLLDRATVGKERGNRAWIFIKRLLEWWIFDVR